MRGVLLAAAFLLAACEQNYSKPGAGDVQLEADRSACVREARVKFPPAIRQVLVSEGYSDPSTTTCTGYGATVNCTTTPGYYHPPTIMTVDDNQEYRSAEVDACLRDKGWTPVP